MSSGWRTENSCIRIQGSLKFLIYLNTRERWVVLHGVELPLFFVRF